MDKLTYRDGYGEAFYCDSGTEADHLHFIADVEDILGEDYDLDRLRELVQADRDGRCKAVPDVVYQADSGGRIYPIRVKKIIYDAEYIAFTEDAIGKSVFLTRVEAEAALKRESRA